MSEGRDRLNEILRAQGHDVRGDLVIVRPKYSETQGVRQSEVDVEMSTDVGITFAADGVNLDRFYKNPVVLWAHDYDGLPVGRADSSSTLSVECETPTLSAKLIFHLDTELSRETWSLVANGEEIKLELGVVPTEWDFAAGGVYVTKWDLVEISAVPSEECAERIRLRIKGRIISSPAMLRSVKRADAPAEPEPTSDRNEFDESVGPYSCRYSWRNGYSIVGPGMKGNAEISCDTKVRVNELNAAWRHGRDYVAADAPTPPSSDELGRVERMERLEWNAAEAKKQVPNILRLIDVAIQANREIKRMRDALIYIGERSMDSASAEQARTAMEPE